VPFVEEGRIRSTLWVWETAQINKDVFTRVRARRSVHTQKIEKREEREDEEKVAQTMENDRAGTKARGKLLFADDWSRKALCVMQVLGVRVVSAH